MVVEIVVLADPQLVRLGVRDDFVFQSLVEIIVVLSSPRHAPLLANPVPSLTLQHLSPLPGKCARARIS